MKALLSKLAGISIALWNFYLPLLRELFVTGVTALLPYAVEVVRSLNRTELSSSQKRNEALDKLRDHAVNQGIIATESLLRWTVESAVQRVKLIK